MLLRSSLATLYSTFSDVQSMGTVHLAPLGNAGMSWQD